MNIYRCEKCGATSHLDPYNDMQSKFSGLKFELRITEKHRIDGIGNYTGEWCPYAQLTIRDGEYQYNYGAMGKSWRTAIRWVCKDALRDRQLAKYRVHSMNES